MASKTFSPRQLGLLDENPFQVTMPEQTDWDRPNEVALGAPPCCWACRGDMNKGLSGQRSTPLVEASYKVDDREMHVMVCPVHSKAAD